MFRKVAAVYTKIDCWAALGQ